MRTRVCRRTTGWIRNFFYKLLHVSSCARNSLGGFICGTNLAPPRDRPSPAPPSRRTRSGPRLSPHRMARPRLEPTCPQFLSRARSATPARVAPLPDRRFRPGCIEPGIYPLNEIIRKLFRATAMPCSARPGHHFALRNNHPTLRTTRPNQFRPPPTLSPAARRPSPSSSIFYKK